MVTLPVNVTKPLCPASFKELLPHIDTFIFDADGVLWLGDDVIPGSPGLIDFLIENNKQVIVLTNNATKSRAVYAKKLERLGFNRKLDKVMWWWRSLQQATSGEPDEIEWFDGGSRKLVVGGRGSSSALGDESDVVTCDNNISRPDHVGGVDR
ncbi:hypothetical protein OSTOST_11847 [Ostertagia ostertagi]